MKLPALTAEASLNRASRFGSVIGALPGEATSGIITSTWQGSTPLQVIERGEGDRIWRLIWQLREGNVGD